MCLPNGNLTHSSYWPITPLYPLTNECHFWVPERKRVFFTPEKKVCLLQIRSSLCSQSQGHHPHRCQLPYQAGLQAQRQRPLRPRPSFECSWDLQLMGSSCARLLRRGALHLILGEIGPACNQVCQSSSERRKRGPAVRLSRDGGVKNLPLVIYFAC